jgi:hypothetical protein
VALRRRSAEGGVKPPTAALVSDRRGERVGKGGVKPSGGDQEGERKRTAVDVSKLQGRHQNRGDPFGFGTSLAGVRLLARWCPACRRREPGLRLPHGTWEGVRRYCRIRSGAGPDPARGSVPSGRNREALSTEAAHAGGPACSSEEATVMVVERRSRIISCLVCTSNRGAMPSGGDE